MTRGDLVEPHWKRGHEWDYFDVLPHGYCTWKRGELGLVIEVSIRKPKRDSCCTVFFKGKLIIAFLFEMNIISESSSAQEAFEKFQRDFYEGDAGE